jgi:hypothetical protein
VALRVRADLLVQADDPGLILLVVIVYNGSAISSFVERVSMHSKMHGIYRKTGRSGACGATVLRQSIPSISSAS